MLNKSGLEQGATFDFLFLRRREESLLRQLNRRTIELGHFYVFQFLSDVTKTMKKNYKNDSGPEHLVLVVVAVFYSKTARDSFLLVMGKGQTHTILLFGPLGAKFTSLAQQVKNEVTENLSLR